MSIFEFLGGIDQQLGFAAIADVGEGGRETGLRGNRDGAGPHRSFDRAATGRADVEGILGAGTEFELAAVATEVFAVPSPRRGGREGSGGAAQFGREVDRAGVFGSYVVEDEDMGSEEARAGQRRWVFVRFDPPRGRGPGGKRKQGQSHGRAGPASSDGAHFLPPF